MHNCLPMGCLPSRSTTVSPVEVSTNSKTAAAAARQTNDQRRAATKTKPIISQNGQAPKKMMVNGVGGGGGDDGGTNQSLQRRQRMISNNMNISSNQQRDDDVNVGDQSVRQSMMLNRGHSGGNSSADSLNAGVEDEIMSILMNDQKKTDRDDEDQHRRPLLEPTNRGELDETENDQQQLDRIGADGSGGGSPEDGTVAIPNNNEGALVSADLELLQQQQQAQQRNSTTDDNSMSFDEELNVDLMRQYIIVDFEISQLEDKDALRIYHEKIEQLEQLERELDMISTEAEEVAARSETNITHQLGFQSPSDFSKTMMDGGESTSLLSGPTAESMSPKSSLRRGNNQQQHQHQQQLINSNKSRQHYNKRALNANGRQMSMFKNNVNNNNNNNTSGSNSIINGSNNNNSNNNINHSSNNINHNDLNDNQISTINNSNNSINNSNTNNNSSYSTVEEVFNRKIILEKERDKLKKEVEMVIIECDKLQNRYKRRDEILDKLFDGRTGNGLENHLEQQLNWLMEQKHYVDQVFYAWKRAETLTSQTCEQFASALELLKRLPMIQDESQRGELTESIGQLLIKSRQDMEQAQRYNPNVDAPFFTDTETERFDKIIETISLRSISQADYSQIVTVIQFAYKRAVSIRLWLEQILQITIARDSFELAEEYKWIAIQLRKERITLIKSKLQDAPYRAMAQTIHEQLIRQQQQQQQQQLLSITNIDSATTTLRGNRIKSHQGHHQQQQQQQRATNEVNRDSGIESDDIDIEEEIYRLLEMNKTRLEAAIAATTTTNGGGGQQAPEGSNNEAENSYQLKPSVNGQMQSISGGSARGSQMNDQMMRERIERRVRGEQQLALAGGNRQQPIDLDAACNPSAPGNKQQHEANGSIGTATSQMSASSATPSKIRVELDEATRQKLLRQVDQTHEKHRSRMESLRGNNKAKASDLILNRMQQARKYQVENEKS